MASDDDIKPGDIVELKSGGPNMTVGSVNDKEICECVWFIGQPFQRDTGRFPTATLRKSN